MVEMAEIALTLSTYTRRRILNQHQDLILFRKSTCLEAVPSTGSKHKPARLLQSRQHAQMHPSKRRRRNMSRSSVCLCTACQEKKNTVGLMVFPIWEEPHPDGTLHKNIPCASVSQ